VITAGDAAAGIALQNQITDATGAILLARFKTRPIPNICAMGGITLEDFTQSVVFREICGGLTTSQEARIRAPGACWDKASKT
jgi:hypothetical protein